MKLTDKQLKKMHEIQVEILDEFDRICNKYNLKYILAGGTCLGAVRHNGFIPWDDDIDIAMTREDYDKFIEIQEKELNHNLFYFQSIETNPDVYNNLFGKIRRKDSIYCEEISTIPEEEQGIWIDIFPLDNTSNNNLIAKYYLIKITILKILYAKKMGNTNYSDKLFRKILLKILDFSANLFSKKGLQKKLYKNVTKFNKKETKKVASYGGKYLFKEIYDKKIILKRTKHKFEKKEYYIPKDYDEHLTNVYGANYMDIPPKEKRNQEHFIKKIKFPD